MRQLTIAVNSVTKLNISKLPMRQLTDSQKDLANALVSKLPMRQLTSMHFTYAAVNQHR